MAAKQENNIETTLDSPNKAQNLLARMIKSASSVSLPSTTFAYLAASAAEVFAPSPPSPLHSNSQHLLPRLKAGHLMIEINGSKWKQYIVALAGTSIADLALYYYKNPADKMAVGSIALHSAHVDVMEVWNKYVNSFTIISNDVIFLIGNDHGDNTGQNVVSLCRKPT